MQLVTVDGALLEDILDHTFTIWNEGLTRLAYSRWNAAQLRTRWGRAHLQRFALVDEHGRLLSTAKRYRFDATLDDRAIRMCGVGAVFTPVDRRGHGYATALLEQLLDRERRDGVELATLFSEIGPAFYRRVGFEPVPLDEMTVVVARKDGAPATLVRAGDERDLPVIAAMHDTRSTGVRFTLRRDPPLIQYALARKRLLAGLGPSGLRHVEFFVVEEGASAVAYAVCRPTRTDGRSRKPAIEIPRGRGLERCCRCSSRASRLTARRSSARGGRVRSRSLRNCSSPSAAIRKTC
jgi:GNAT superfamily N-acetyltransferase